MFIRRYTRWVKKYFRRKYKPSPAFLNWNSGGNLTDNVFLLNGFISINECHTQTIIPKSVTINKLAVILNNSPGQGTRFFTLRINGIDTQLKVSLTGDVTTVQNSNKIKVHPFDLISIHHVSTGTVNDSNGMVTVELI